jgi:hypothetical protein
MKNELTQSLFWQGLYGEKNINTSNYNIYAELNLQIITAISFRIYIE